LLHLVLTPVEFLVSDGDQFLGRVRDHLGGELEHQPVAANGVAADVAVIARARGGGPAAGLTSAALAATESGAATTAARAAEPAARPAPPLTADLSHRRPSLSGPQSDDPLGQPGGVIAERLIERFVRLLRPPGEERVVAIVITEPRAQH